MSNHHWDCPASGGRNASEADCLHYKGCPPQSAEIGEADRLTPKEIAEIKADHRLIVILPNLQAPPKLLSKEKLQEALSLAVLGDSDSASSIENLVDALEADNAALKKELETRGAVNAGLLATLTREREERKSAIVRARNEGRKEASQKAREMSDKFYDHARNARTDGDGVAWALVGASAVDIATAIDAKLESEE